MKNDQKRSENIKKHQKRSHEDQIRSKKITLVFCDVFWCFLMFFDPFWSFLIDFDRKWSKVIKSDRFCQGENEFKDLFRMIKNDQKRSKKIRKDQKTSKKITLWSDLIKNDHFGVLWCFLMFFDVFWSFLIIFDHFWSILVIRWWSCDVFWCFLVNASLYSYNFGDFCRVPIEDFAKNDDSEHDFDDQH